MTGWLLKFCLPVIGNIYGSAILITLSIYTITAFVSGLYQLVAGKDNWWPTFLNNDCPARIRFRLSRGLDSDRDTLGLKAPQRGAGKEVWRKGQAPLPREVPVSPVLHLWSYVAGQRYDEVMAFMAPG